MPLTVHSKDDKTPERVAFALRASTLFAVVVVLLVAFGVLVGWLVDSRELKTVFYYQKVVPGNFAVFWLFTALSFFSIVIGGKRRWLSACGAIVSGLLMAVTLYATLVGYFFHHLPYSSYAIQFLPDATAIEIPGNIVWVEALPIFTVNLFMLLVYFRQYAKSNLLLIVITLWPMCQALVGYAFDLPDLFTFCTNEECARLHPILALFAVAMSLSIAVQFLALRAESAKEPAQSVES